ncbi:response regulator [Campylobacter sp. faydin G-140]|uniref:response regulator n=1 Tax=Campylobacter anatolicus TaxID=2829105 RepID=UPI001B8DEE6E|nr:response regulator [Campylobacter anatolicus]MBR8465765.1 response regulator [Campylobacter anatolicus]
MRILIVENEIYLAGSMASKLGDLGHECEIAKSVKEAIGKDDSFDVVLLSTTLPGQDFYPIIDKFKERIIILLIAYISSDTVLKPIQAGADDYIQKPFMIEELVRKINHFEEHRRIKSIVKNYENYIQYSLEHFKINEFDPKKIKLPLLIKTPKINYADKFVYTFMQMTKNLFIFTPATSFNDVEKAIKQNAQEHIYITNFQLLKQDERDRILVAVYKKKVIISTTDLEQSAPFETLEIANNDQLFSIDEIVTIDNYIKYVISNYQDRFPDTELSKKLGISRKSLWEKRKKYDIIKKK